jgi:hypothetical protein
MITSRRRFLAGTLLAVIGSGCARVAERVPAPPGPTATPELDAWRTEAQAMLKDALRTLRTFDEFAAYRVSVTASSGMRSPSELVWDPPTGQAWDDATYVARGLHGRADSLFQAITTAHVDPSVWRDQRSLAELVRDIGDVGDALAVYRNRIDRLPPGDASGALSLLDAAWKQWETVAASVGMARAEDVGCSA